MGFLENAHNIIDKQPHPTHFTQNDPPLEDVPIHNSFCILANDQNLDSSTTKINQEDIQPFKAIHSNSKIVKNYVKKKGKRVTRVTGIILNTKTQIIS